MAREVNFAVLDEKIENDDRLSAARSQRWKRREANPTVQMSVRMPEDIYDRFRSLCEMERRTNGEMLQRMLEHYVATTLK